MWRLNKIRSIKSLAQYLVLIILNAKRTLLLSLNVHRPQSQHQQLRGRITGTAGQLLPALPSENAGPSGDIAVRSQTTAQKQAPNEAGHLNAAGGTCPQFVEKKAISVKSYGQRAIK